jgi:hypothetical protein
MITITKSRVAEWMLLSYLAKQRQITDKIEIFERKYKLTFPIFEEQIKSNETQDFEMWDDYIEWKAFTDFYQQTLKITQDVRIGNFQVRENIS